MRKHQLTRGKLGTAFTSLNFFGPLVFGQHSDRLGVKCDHPSTSLALRRPHPDRVRNLDHALDDGELLALEIDVTPTYPQHLAATHAGRSREVEGGIELILSNRLEETPEVVRTPRLKLPWPRSPRGRRISGERWIGLQVPKPHGVSEGLAED